MSTLQEFDLQRADSAATDALLTLLFQETSTPRPHPHVAAQYG